MPTSPDIYTLIVGGNLCNQPVENVLHFHCTTPTPSDPIVQADDLNTLWDSVVSAAWINVHPDNYFYIGTKTRRCSSLGGPTLGKLQPAGTSGARGSDASDSAIGPVVIAPYNLGGRWATAKLFINGAGDDDLDNNVFSNGLLTALDALITILEAGLTGMTSSFEYCAFRTAPTDTYAPLANLGVSVKPGVQNRRLRPVF